MLFNQSLLLLIFIHTVAGQLPSNLYPHKNARPYNLITSSSCSFKSKPKAYHIYHIFNAFRKIVNMSAIQLSFDLRTSSTVKTVHLLGSWDNYAGQLPLAKDKNSSKSGAWKGTFKFQGSLLQAGQRYWYYVSWNSSELCSRTLTTSSTLSMATTCPTTQVKTPPPSQPPVAS